MVSGWRPIRFESRGDWIRTSDLLNPIQARFRTAPRPVQPSTQKTPVNINIHIGACQEKITAQSGQLYLILGCKDVLYNILEQRKSEFEAAKAYHEKPTGYRASGVS